MTAFGWPPWVVMWAIAVAIFALCKWLTWRATPAPDAPAWRHLAYFLAWPGLDARAFLDPRPLTADQRPEPDEWVLASAKLAAGIVIVWGFVPQLPGDVSLLHGWVGMVGLVFVLHFGSFHLLSCAWRAAGVNAKSLMNWPVLASSVSEFWGKRWNTAFRDMTYRFLFRPMTARLDAAGALVAGFLASGLVHDLVISVPAGGGYGGPTLYFFVQGLALLIERSAAGRRLGLGRGWCGRLFAVAIIVGPAYWLFHPPFILNVVLPFLDAVGAVGRR